MQNLNTTTLPHNDTTTPSNKSNQFRTFECYKWKRSAISPTCA